jgi:hypothetical protein
MDGRKILGIRRAPSTSLGISPAGSYARKTAQLRLRARQLKSIEYPGGAALRMTEINILLEYKFVVL